MCCKEICSKINLGLLGCILSIIITICSMIHSGLKTYNIIIGIVTIIAIKANYLHSLGMNISQIFCCCCRKKSEIPNFQNLKKDGKQLKKDLQKILRLCTDLKNGDDSCKTLFVDIENLYLKIVSLFH